MDARTVCNIDLDPACMDKLVWGIDCKALSNHLGGWCSLPFSKYIVLFGRPSNAHFFGDRVAEGLRALIAQYWRKQIERGSRGCWDLVQPAVRPSDFVAWLGVFQAPLNFSKANAQRPVSNENPLGPQQYPAVFFLTQAQHTSLVKSPMPVSAAIMGRAAKNPNVVAELHRALMAHQVMERGQEHDVPGVGAAPRVLGLPNTSRGDHSSLRSTPNGAGCTGPEESSARMCSRGCRTSASVCCGGLPFVWSSTRMDLAFIHDCAKRRGCNRLIYHFYQWMQELAGRESALGGREHFHLRARTSLVLTKGSLRANPNNEEAGFWFGARTSPILYFP